MGIVNYADQQVALDASFDFEADYADIFEVRGFRRPRRGCDLEPAVLDHRVTFAYRGRDVGVNVLRQEGNIEVAVIL